jgi:hypothetical protein
MTQAFPILVKAMASECLLHPRNKGWQSTKHIKDGPKAEGMHYLCSVCWEQQGTTARVCEPTVSAVGDSSELRKQFQKISV